MTVTVISGKLGAGKTLAAVGRMRDYIAEGRPVATNVDLHAEAWPVPRRRWCVYRLPDHPTAEALWSLPSGNDTVDEDRNGGIFLDECAAWLNARSWQGPARAEFIRWAVHARKLGWDVFLIVQSPTVLDKQIRELVCELHASVRRLDRVAVPGLGGLGRALRGRPFTLPQLHVATCRYGLGIHDLVVDRWSYRARDLYPVYNTRQAFDPLYSSGLYSVLSPWHVRGRYLPPRVPAGVRLGALIRRHVYPLVGGLLVGLTALLTGRQAGELARAIAPRRFPAGVSRFVREWACGSVTPHDSLCRRQV